MLMKEKSANLMLVCAAACVSLMISCSPHKEVAIDYLGQKPPGMKAELFAPDLISTTMNEHSALAFSPDGKTLLWTVMDSNYRGLFYEMTNGNGLWQAQTTPSFADTSSAHFSPTFSVDGEKLFFCSRRAAPSGYREGRGNRIWSVDRTSDGWSTPAPLDTTVSTGNEFGISVSKNGTLYFSQVNAEGDMNIFKAEKIANGYSAPKMLPSPINSAGYEDGPYISPDENFLIFESTRPEGIAGSHDLYICFENNGEWSLPINMGPEINSSAMERFPRVSPDGKYLFFASNRDQTEGRVGFDIYWIDARVIEQLRTKNKG
jgi:Tol biopolymer transport system component